jgi:hypothetical protein
MVEQKRHEDARSPRERLARLRTVAGRGLGYWKGALLVLLVAGAVALGVTAQVATKPRRSRRWPASPRD